jgi:hypothetical protein
MNVIATLMAQQGSLSASSLPIPQQDQVSNVFVIGDEQRRSERGESR